VTDADLVARARQGDPAAFGELVDRHRTAVYRAALAALGSPADAEDAAQDAFVAAYRRLASFRADASFKTWLLTIAWHHAINRRRSLARLWRRFVQPADIEVERGELGDRVAVSLSCQPDPEQLVVDAELRREIRRAILMLPTKLRDALLLAQAGEYTYEEIGSALHVPVGTIKWRVSEARRLVRKRLRDGGYADGR
jgi:RNA polymerase sigma-70 factor (ECF subfamily)